MRKEIAFECGDQERLHKIVFQINFKHRIECQEDKCRERPLAKKIV